jgi:hypothetical protein
MGLNVNDDSLLENIRAINPDFALELESISPEGLEHVSRQELVRKSIEYWKLQHSDGVQHPLHEILHFALACAGVKKYQRAMDAELPILAAVELAKDKEGGPVELSEEEYLAKTRSIYDDLHNVNTNFMRSLRYAIAKATGWGPDMINNHVGAFYRVEHYLEWINEAKLLDGQKLSDLIHVECCEDRSIGRDIYAYSAFYIQITSHDGQQESIAYSRDGSLNLLPENSELFNRFEMPEEAILKRCFRHLAPVIQHAYLNAPPSASGHAEYHSTEFIESVKQANEQQTAAEFLQAQVAIH